MKKTLLPAFAVLLIFCNPFSAKSQTDSAAINREDLYYQYLDIRNNTLQYKEADYIRLTEVLEQIVLHDNRLLDTIEAKTQLYADYQQNLDDKNNEIKRLNETLAAEKKLLFYMMIAAGASFLLFLLFLILFIAKASSMRKYRRKLSAMYTLEAETGELREHTAKLESRLNEMNELCEKTFKEKEQAESKSRDAGLQIVALKTEISGLQTEAARREKEYQNSSDLLNNEISEIKKMAGEYKSQSANDQQLMGSLQQEYEKIQEIRAAETGEFGNEIKKRDEAIARSEQELLELHKEIEQLKNLLAEKEKEKNGPQVNLVQDENFITKASEIELLAMKLEKLESLRQKGILTDQDYLPLKEKFLGEL